MLGGGRGEARADEGVVPAEAGVHDADFDSRAGVAVVAPLRDVEGGGASAFGRAVEGGGDCEIAARAGGGGRRLQRVAALGQIDGARPVGLARADGEGVVGDAVLVAAVRAHAQAGGGLGDCRELRARRLGEREGVALGERAGDMPRIRAAVGRPRARPRPVAVERAGGSDGRVATARGRFHARRGDAQGVAVGVSRAVGPRREVGLGGFKRVAPRVQRFAQLGGEEVEVSAIAVFGDLGFHRRPLAVGFDPD